MIGSNSPIPASTLVDAVKHDGDKARWDLLPDSMPDVVAVFGYGAKKYEEWNWARNGGFKWSRLIAAAFRHLWAFSRGEDVDPESNLPHLAHCVACLLMLLSYMRDTKAYPNDDRRK